MVDELSIKGQQSAEELRLTAEGGQDKLKGHVYTGRITL